MVRMQEVVPASEQELVDLAAGTYVTILRSSREILRLKFELGRLVRIHLQRHKYTHAAVTRLAQSISGLCGKVIVPQRLYEAARYYETFGGELDRVWAFERRMAQPLTYTYLIRSIIPRIHQSKAWNPDEWALYQDAQISRLESAVQEIESLKGTRSKTDMPQVGNDVEPRPQAQPPHAAEEGRMPGPAEGLFEICRESQGYQSFRVTALVSTIVQACAQLEPLEAGLSEEDRQRLGGVLSMITKWTDGVRQEAAA